MYSYIKSCSVGRKHELDHAISLTDTPSDGTQNRMDHQGGTLCCPILPASDIGFDAAMASHVSAVDTPTSMPFDGEMALGASMVRRACIPPPPRVASQVVLG